jgi:hypothetical protein
VISKNRTYLNFAMPTVMIEGARKFSLLFYMLMWLSAVEVMLEYRHHSKGYNTPIFGKIEKIALGEGGSKVNGPTEGFPFRSKIVSLERAEIPVVWFSSASYAEHSSFQVSDIFPTICCHQASCIPLNASRAGMNIMDNVYDLERFSEAKKATYFVLYQMSGDILSLQASAFGGRKKSSVIEKNAIFGLQDRFKTFLLRTSLHVHLKEYLAATLKLQGPLEPSLTASEKASFEHALGVFLDSVEMLGGQPILVTFATMYAAENYQDMPYGIKTSFMRYGNQLSISGWMKTVREFNNVIREVGKSRDIPIVDIEPIMTGRAELFVDYVHFSELGHKVIAREIANKIIQMQDANDI